MKFTILSLIALISLNTHAFSTCRNATNTVIYKTAGNFQELQAAQIIAGKQVLQDLSLEEHKIELFERILLDTQIQGSKTVITSSVKIEVTKNDGTNFNQGFLNLSSDQMAIETTYICETIN